MPSKRPITVLRLDDDVRRKLQYIADDNFRTVNAEVTRLILLHIADYERDHGPIHLPEGVTDD
ncbi:MAG: TraY domain-containing protein [Clostridia bacterium]|nr:TraY domain-containing protein [Clostridia bacterium]